MTGFTSKRQMAQDKVAQPAQEPDELAVAYMSGLYDGIKAEREACAKLCEPQEQHDDPLTTWQIVKAIRARGQA